MDFLDFISRLTPSRRAEIQRIKGGGGGVTPQASYDYEGYENQVCQTIKERPRSSISFDLARRPWWGGGTLRAFRQAVMLGSLRAGMFRFNSIRFLPNPVPSGRKAVPSGSSAEKIQSGSIRFEFQPNPVQSGPCRSDSNPCPIRSNPV